MNISISLTDKEKDKVNLVLKAHGFRSIEWKGDMVYCGHSKEISPCDAVRKAGFFVPCGGVSHKGHGHCTVWSKKRYFSKARLSEIIRNSL